MAEIKSTLELVMERTRNLSMSDEDKLEQAAKEFKDAVNRLCLKYLDGHIDIESFREKFRSRAHQLCAPHALWRALGQLLLASFPSNSRARFIPIYNQVEATSTPTYPASSTDSEYTSTTIRLIKFLLVVFNAQKLDYFLALLLMQLDLSTLASYYSESSCLYYSNAYFQARYQSVLPPPILAAKGSSALSPQVQSPFTFALAQFPFAPSGPGPESLLEPSDLFGPLEQCLLLLASANVHSMGPLDVENAIQSFLDGQDIKRRIMGPLCIPHPPVSSPPPPPPHATNLQLLSKVVQTPPTPAPAQPPLAHIGSAAAFAEQQQTLAKATGAGVAVASGTSGTFVKPPMPMPTRQVHVSNGARLSTPASISPSASSRSSRLLPCLAARVSTRRRQLRAPRRAFRVHPSASRTCPHRPAWSARARAPVPPPPRRSQGPPRAHRAASHHRHRCSCTRSSRLRSLRVRWLRRAAAASPITPTATATVR